MEDGLIKCTFSTQASLYLAYMPFVKGGGLFIRTLQPLPMGKEVTLEIQILNETEHYKLQTQVIWITPKGAQGNKPSGIGLQFTGANARNFCNKIETILAAMLKSNQLTDTF